MGSNISDIDQSIELFKTSDVNCTNESVLSEIRCDPLYPYARNSSERWLIFRCVIGSLIIVCNLTVVISSGLIIKKGQQPKSTYLLLGNVSLADTLIGIFMIFVGITGTTVRSDQLCIFRIGIIICSAKVSIFSVCLLAVDRYIYILHGLYYQKWFNTTRVRIGIVCIWVIGIALGFAPVTGWTNSDPFTSYCVYGSVFPNSVTIVNAILSIIPIVIVTLLNSIILFEALRNLRNIKASTVTLNHGDTETTEKPKLRIHRDTYKKPNQPLNQQCNGKIKRSASFHLCDSHIFSPQGKVVELRSKSADDLKFTLNGSGVHIDNIKIQGKSGRLSDSSISTMETIIENYVRKTTEHAVPTLKALERPYKKVCKINGPKKWRAITVVLLTSGSFIVTWTPFYVVVLLSIFSEDKHRKAQLASLVTGPIGIFAFINSFLNPLIYAWWHKGFKTSIRIHFRQYLQRHTLSKSIRARARDR